MPRGIRKQEGENLTEANIAKVIQALNQEKPITKKVACEMLQISYNTARLNKVIENHIETINFRKEMRKSLRSVPIDNATASDIVSSYLSNISLIDISNSTHRSTNVIKNVLSKYNIPIRNKAVDYWHPTFIADSAIAEDYKKDDLVFSARYDLPATVVKMEITEKHGMVCDLQLHGLKRRRVSQPYYELADLRKLQTELNIEMKDLDTLEVRALINEGLRNQKKQEDKRK